MAQQQPRLLEAFQSSPERLMDKVIPLFSNLWTSYPLVRLFSHKPCRPAA